MYILTKCNEKCENEPRETSIYCPSYFDIIVCTYNLFMLQFFCVDNYIADQGVDSLNILILNLNFYLLFINLCLKISKY